MVAIMDLPLWLLVCAEVILGLGGDCLSVEVIALAYIADVYPRNKQSFRYVVVSMIEYIGFGVSQTGIGQILQLTNSFVISFACGTITAACATVYVCIPYFIPESISREDIPKDMVKKMFQNYIRLFKKNTRGSRKNQLVLFFTFVSDSFYYLVHSAIFAVITIYGIAAPFCWTPFQTGIYATMVNMVPAFCKYINVK